MEVETKKAIFTSDQIIIKKRKQNIVIPLDKVDRMLYAKFTIKNYFALIAYGKYGPGGLYIQLKEKINNKKMYCFYIKYENIIKVPKNIYKKISFFGSEIPMGSTDPWY